MSSLKQNQLHLFRQILANEADPELRCSVRSIMRQAKRVQEDDDRSDLIRDMKALTPKIKSRDLKTRLRELIFSIEDTPRSDSESSISSSSSDDQYHRVVRITGLRISRDNKRSYRVHWAGYDDSDDDTWEPMDKLIEDGCGEFIAHFHSQVRRMV